MEVFTGMEIPRTWFAFFLFRSCVRRCFFAGIDRAAGNGVAVFVRTEIHNAQPVTVLTAGPSFLLLLDMRGAQPVCLVVLDADIVVRSRKKAAPAAHFALLVRVVDENDGSAGSFDNQVRGFD